MFDQKSRLIKQVADNYRMNVSTKKVNNPKTGKKRKNSTDENCENSEMQGGKRTRISGNTKRGMNHQEDNKNHGMEK